MDIMSKIINFSFNLGAHYFCNKFEADTKDAARVNKQVLTEILQTNQESEYGRRYNFANITGSEEYKQVVPLTSYGDYEGYIARIASGEQNVLTAEPVEYFGLSSGTTGQQKFIPVTDKTRKLTNLSMNFLRQGLLCRALPAAKAGGKALLLMNILDSGRTPVGIPTGAGTSEGMKSMKKLLPYLWTSPIEVLEQKDQQKANYLHLLFALQQQKLAYIVAPFPSGIVQLLKVLENHWPQLIKDIASGTVSGHLQLEQTVKESLEQRLKPNPKRATQLEAQFTQGMQGIVQRIWPQMYYVCCVLGGSFSIYIEQLKYYTGQLPLFSAVYCATEALIGMSVKTDDATYVVTPNTAYFEFIPIEDAEAPNPLALDIDQLETGQSYEVVITNYAGFYRYRLGDVVKVVDYYHKSPVIEFLYRKGQLLNVAGEKTSELAVQEAVQQAVQEVGGAVDEGCPTEVQDYTVSLDLEASVGYYKFYLEVRNPDVLLTNIIRLRERLELALGVANPRYRSGLETGRIAPLTVQLIKPGTFEVLRQQLLQKGASANQVKIPRLVRDQQLICTLEENILADKTSEEKL